MKPISMLSPNQEPRPPGVAIDSLILHYTGMNSAKAALARFCNPETKVSAHYLVDEDGMVFLLVPEEKRAWHAGVSSWRRETNINDRSIGIELVNPGHEFGYRPFPEKQMAALIPLLREILARHSIPPPRVLGHSDVAPGRKSDPGELFDWARLAESGIGLWPESAKKHSMKKEPLPPVSEVQSMLWAYGYSVPRNGVLDSETKNALIAFQRHFRPERIDGAIDSETFARLSWLLEHSAA
ncbi:MAG: N-acetylmuramoyl-L-alanine amidase [Alphaproteobacteria bacterium]